MIRFLLLGSIGAVVLLASVPAFADSAILLGSFQNWSAYSTGSGDSLTCYAMSMPRATEPKKARRGQIYLMVSDWPSRKIKGEPQIVPGYPYKPNAPVYLEIGGDKFEFFARNDGQSGAAWLRDLNDGDKLIRDLTDGLSAVAIGLSTRGTRTVDTYSLDGFTDAMAKAHAVCHM